MPTASMWSQLLIHMSTSYSILISLTCFNLIFQVRNFSSTAVNNLFLTLIGGTSIHVFTSYFKWSLTFPTEVKMFKTCLTGQENCVERT